MRTRKCEQSLRSVASQSEEDEMPVYEKLSELKISLPEVTPPAAAYIPFVRTGNIVFVSGHIAKKDGKPWAGKRRGALRSI
jgi:enamine deaminase RidA (YjgF/YER057c/UK114 family)